MNQIVQKFQEAKTKRSSTNQHLETLRQLATECSHITEFGVCRVVSTWAFLLGCKGKIVSYDIVQHKEIDEALEICRQENVNWTFIKESSIKVEIEPTDMLFIDDLHIGEHLQKEIDLHATKVHKYIVMHDTEKHKTAGEKVRIHGDQGYQRGKIDGLWPVIERMVASGVWRIKAHYKYNWGLTVLERVL